MNASDKSYPKLEYLKERIFLSDNRACFIERERILSRLNVEMTGYEEPDRYAKIFSMLLSKVSTPIDAHDYFVGRVVEALPDEGMVAPSAVLYSDGHMSFDYEKILRLGLAGILDEIERNAQKKGDGESLSFARNARIVVTAIRDYAKRYADAAEAHGMAEAASALRTVPFLPAYDLYSALQGIWLLHMIASCYVGSRDYAFGRFDQYLLPFYEKAIRDGKTEDEICELVAGFLIKTNEICGRTTFNHCQKPVRSHAAKQYVNIGGDAPNALSSLVLRAAMLFNLAQPQIVVLLKPEADESFTKNVFEALCVLTDKMNIYHYDTVVRSLVDKGIEESVAKAHTYSACCTLDLNYHSFRREYFVEAPRIFLEALNRKEYHSLEEILCAFKESLTEAMQRYANTAPTPFDREKQKKLFVLDSILLSDCATECQYPGCGKEKYILLNLFCPGIATLGDSLMVLDRLIFKEQRYRYTEFLEILKNDFSGNEELKSEILHYTKFGNDTDADQYTVMAANAFLDAVDALTLKKNVYAVGSFYSLERDNTTCLALGATPDGRASGSPFSENQSPTYGADTSGITALLKSVAKLPFSKTGSGGLNLTLSKSLPAPLLQSLVVSYFKLGGLHVGISVIDRNALLDAMEHPERHKSLTVRLYGFSEYFISLPQWQQLAVLNRTEYGG